MDKKSVIEISIISHGKYYLAMAALVIGILLLVFASIIYLQGDQGNLKYLSITLYPGLFFVLVSIIFYFVGRGIFKLSKDNDGKFSAYIKIGKDIFIDADPLGNLEYFYFIIPGVKGRIDVTEYSVFSDKNKVRKFALFHSRQVYSFEALPGFKQIRISELKGIPLFRGPVREIYDLYQVSDH